MEIDVKRMRELLADVNAVTDGDYLSRMANGGRIALACAEFIREHGPELLRVYEAWQAAPVVDVYEMHDGRIVTDAPGALNGQRVRLVADSALTINPDEIDSRLIVEDKP